MENLKYIKEVLKEVDLLSKIESKLNFDVQVNVPPQGQLLASDQIGYIDNKIYHLIHSSDYQNAVINAYKNIDNYEEYDALLVKYLYEEYLKNKNVTSELSLNYLKATNKAFSSWLECKEKSDYKSFYPQLEKVVKLTKEKILTREKQGSTIYDTILNDFEKGSSIAKLDNFFSLLKEELLPLIKKIKESKKVISSSFLFTPITIERQKEFSKYLLKLENHSKDYLVFLTSEHPFTSSFGKGDERITTHFYENDFFSNVFSTLHEGGHALFDQNEPAIYDEHFISGHMTMAEHECMSRFYENMIGRSKEFISLIYPTLITQIPEFKDLSVDEIYEAINIATPSLIRTEADELTYPFHILIRYEMEKEFINGEVDFSSLNKRWNELYKEYLGIEVPSDKEGILQDVHWCDTYGYFPSYALGSAYAAQIYHYMNTKFDVKEAIREGNIKKINDFLINNVFPFASIMDVDEWIKKVTEEEFNPMYYISYLKEKFTSIYSLEGE